MSGGHWEYMADPIREVGGPMVMIFDALGDLERIMDWAESGDSVRESRDDRDRRRFVEDVDRILEGKETTFADGVEGVAQAIAVARGKLEEQLSGEREARERRAFLDRTGRSLGKTDRRGAEAEAYDRLVLLFDALSRSGVFSWRR